jgi:hypothetical protein
MKNICFLLTTLLLFTAATSRADEVVILQQTARNFDRWSTTPYGRDHVLTQISRETGVPTDVLAEQRRQTGLGYGGLFIANSLASETGRTFDEIAALKASGHGWGWIAKQYNVKLGPIVSRAHHADKALKRELKKEKGKVKKSKKNKTEKLYADSHRSKGNHKNSDRHKAGRSTHSNLHSSFHGHGHGKGH